MFLKFKQKGKFIVHEAQELRLEGIYLHYRAAHDGRKRSTPYFNLVTVTDLFPSSLEDGETLEREREEEKE